MTDRRAEPEVGGRASAATHRSRFERSWRPYRMKPPGRSPGRPVGLVLAGALFMASAPRAAALPSSSLVGPEDSIAVGLVVLEAESDGRTADAVIRASEMALRDANLRAGADGQPFRLVVREQTGRWDAGAGRIAELVFEQNVRAVLGSIGGRSAHLVEQIVTKGGVAFATPWATDPTLSQINLPWFFSCVPDDEQQAAALVTEIFEKQQLSRVVTVFERSYDAEMAERAFVTTAERVGRTVGRRIAIDDVRAAAQSIVEEKPKAVVLYTSARSVRELLGEMRGLANPGPASTTFFGPISLADMELSGEMRGLKNRLHVVVPGQLMDPGGTTISR